MHSWQHFEPDRPEWQEHEDENKLFLDCHGCGGLTFLPSHASSDLGPMAERGVLFPAHFVRRFRQLAIGDFNMVSIGKSSSQKSTLEIPESPLKNDLVIFLEF